MRREEFLVRLNSEASRLGVPEITDGILGDWLEAKIIAAPQKKGRIRNWSEKELEQGQQILRLLSLGVKGLGEIRFHLWLDDPNICLFNPKFDAPGILSREFLRFKNTWVGSFRSNYWEKGATTTSFSARSVLRKMGNLDPCFEPWVRYSPEELLNLYTMLRFGSSKGNLGEALASICPKIENQIIGIVEQLVPEISSCVLRAAIGNIPDRAFSQVIRHFNLDEINQTILDASKSEFLLARQCLHALIILFRWLALQKVSDSLRHPEWQTVMFAVLLHLIHRNRDGIFGFEPEVIGFITKNQHFRMISMA